MTKQRLIIGDCLERLKQFKSNTFTAVVCDPPYGLKFMGKTWDHGVPGVPFWEEILRVCKPGAMLMAFGGTRTHHRLMVAIEDAGWEVRDCLMWLHGQGFPKSADISKHIDRAAGAEREVVGERHDGAGNNGGGLTGGDSWTDAGKGVFGEGHSSFDITAPATEAAKRWEGYGTALKPAVEIICLAMAPLDGTFANNALVHGVAGLNIDAGRISTAPADAQAMARCNTPGSEHMRGRDPIQAVRGNNGSDSAARPLDTTQGRWPANLILSHIEPDENGEGGCRCVGVRKVGSGKRVIGGTPRKTEGHVCTGSPDRSTALMCYGTEQVEDWECVEGCPVRLLDEQIGELPSSARPNIQGKYFAAKRTIYSSQAPRQHNSMHFGEGGTSRFFYHAKSSRSEREAGLLGHVPCAKCGRLRTREHEIDGKKGKCIRNIHPTVKPLGLMRYLVGLVKMPEGNMILDPFCGSGSTIVACRELGVSAVGIDNDPHSVQIALARVRHAKKG